MSLVGQKALITGGSQGVGRALAIGLSRLGCSTTVIGRSEAGLRETVNQLSLTDKTQYHNYVKFDLTLLYSGTDALKQGSSITNLTSVTSSTSSLLEVAETDQSVDLTTGIQNTSILINCAGITNHKLLPRLSDKDIITTLNLNLTAPILLSKMCFKPLLYSNKGSSFTPTIINISSILATSSTVPGTSVYAASKAGLLGFTSSLAAELKGKVRVNAILPGLIQETNMGANANIDTIQIVSLEKVVKVTIDTILDQSANGKHVVVE